MSEATRTAESKKELYRQEIHNLRETVKELEQKVSILLEIDARNNKVAELQSKLDSAKHCIGLAIKVFRAELGPECNRRMICFMESKLRKL